MSVASGMGRLFARRWSPARQYIIATTARPGLTRSAVLLATLHTETRDRKELSPCSTMVALVYYTIIYNAYPRHVQVSSRKRLLSPIGKIGGRNRPHVVDFAPCLGSDSERRRAITVSRSDRSRPTVVSALGAVIRSEVQCPAVFNRWRFGWARVRTARPPSLQKGIDAVTLGGGRRAGRALARSKGRGMRIVSAR